MTRRRCGGFAPQPSQQLRAATSCVWRCFFLLCSSSSDGFKTPTAAGQKLKQGFMWNAELRSFIRVLYPSTQQEHTGSGNIYWESGILDEHFLDSNSSIRLCCGFHGDHRRSSLEDSCFFWIQYRFFYITDVRLLFVPRIWVNILWMTPVTDLNIFRIIQQWSTRSNRRILVLIINQKTDVYLFVSSSELCRFLQRKLVCMSVTRVKEVVHKIFIEKICCFF